MKPTENKSDINDGCTLSGCSCGCAGMFLVLAFVGLAAIIMLTLGFLTFV